MNKSYFQLPIESSGRRPSDRAYLEFGEPEVFLQYFGIIVYIMLSCVTDGVGYAPRVIPHFSVHVLSLQRLQLTLVFYNLLFGSCLIMFPWRDFLV